MRTEPTINLPVPAATAAPAETPLLAPPPPRQEVRSMSPRELAAWAYELYLEGCLTWPEYRMLGFPSELHPRFDETIGALTGERAEPDRPRDMLTIWERRLEFERRYNLDSPETIRRSERIVHLLRQADAPRVALSLRR